MQRCTNIEVDCSAAANQRDFATPSRHRKEQATWAILNVIGSDAPAHAVIQTYPGKAAAVALQVGDAFSRFRNTDARYRR